MKILVTGSRGMLAHDVIPMISEEHEVLATDIHNLDICSPSAVEQYISCNRPDIIINCASFTNVDACETETDSAFSVNAEGVKHLANMCRKTGALLYHISTDFVFDGTKKTPYTPDDIPNPLSVYAKSKYRGEQYIQEILPRYVIIRTSWLFGAHGRNFVSAILGKLKQEEPLRVVNDQTGCPTCTVDLAGAVRALLAVPAQGVYHMCNDGQCSWYDFAVKIAELSGFHAEITPVSSSMLNRPARRPAYSVMDCSKLIEQTGFRPRHWHLALAEYLNHPELNV